MPGQWTNPARRSRFFPAMNRPSHSRSRGIGRINPLSPNNHPRSAGGLYSSQLNWGCPALGQFLDVCQGHLGIQTVEYLLNDAGDDLYRPAADGTGFDIDVEHPLQALRPRHRDVTWRWVLFIGQLGLAALAALRRGDPCAELTVGGEHAVEACQIYSGPGDQGRQSGDEVQGLIFNSLRPHFGLINILVGPV